MNEILIITTTFVAVLIGTLIANIIIRKKTSASIDDTSFEDKIARLSSEALDKNSQRFLLLAKEVLTSQKNEIRTDLEGKKSAISNLIDEIRKDIRKNEDRLARSDEQRVQSFSALRNELETYKKITTDLKISTDELKTVLSNNQTRGAFGEQIAENLLKMAGFVVGHDYQKNKTVGEGKTRPDFTIFLPDQTKINIDVKFPYASLVKSVEAKTTEEKKKHFVDFKKDVREKIKQVTTRDYINPEEHTVDFVILFIPNEMIFSYIYDKMNEVWEEAIMKKVVFAGPFSFTAILRMVKQAYDNFRYQENLQHIIGLIQKFDTEYEKYSKSVDVLGDRISSVSRQYDEVSNTRHRKLSSVVDKIKTQEIKDAEEVKLIENEEGTE